MRKGWVETNLAKLNLVAYLEKVIYWYLDCGDHHIGFARVKCGDCNHEYLLAFSCKRQHFCPSYHQKRVVEFGERLSLVSISNRYFLFTSA